MALVHSKFRTFQSNMAVVCLLLASGGFVVAGYVDTSAADAAIRTAQHTANASAVPSRSAGLDSLAAHGSGRNISFAMTLIGAQGPSAKQFLDLTDPTAKTPHLARSVEAMRAEIPEISAELLSAVRKDILAAAYQGLGRPYVWGGTSLNNGWDCSGFVQWAYKQAGVGLPRTEQWAPMVRTASPQPGDIVVQNPDGPGHWSHIGIYIGKGLMISALNPSVGTILHAPGDVSSSSSYFTMPAFAETDAKAKAAAAAKEKAVKETSASPAPSKSASPPESSAATGSHTPTPAATETGKPGTIPPGTTPPRTTGPGTTPAAPEVKAPPEEVPTSSATSTAERPVPNTPSTGAAAVSGSW